MALPCCSLLPMLQVTPQLPHLSARSRGQCQSLATSFLLFHRVACFSMICMMDCCRRTHWNSSRRTHWTQVIDKNMVNCDRSTHYGHVWNNRPGGFLELTVAASGGAYEQPSCPRHAAAARQSKPDWHAATAPASLLPMPQTPSSLQTPCSAATLPMQCMHD